MIDGKRIEFAQRIADKLIESLGLSVPVDIRFLVENYATIHALPDDVPDLDAVLLGLDKEENHVFLNERRSRKRVRFTLAHELGHILLPWHLAHELVCDSDSGDTDEGIFSSHLRKLDPNYKVIAAQEIEADAFAARILVPKVFLQTLLNEPVATMLEKLETADVSPQAGLRALSEALSPGYIFALLDNEDLVDAWWTSGASRQGLASVQGINKGSPIQTSLATRTMVETGRSFHFGRIVWWGRAEVDVEVSPGSSDWRSPMELILRDITESEEELGNFRKSIAGIVGALNSEVKGEPVGRIAVLLITRFKRRIDFDNFVRNQYFGEFVSARARALYAGNLKNKVPRKN